MSDNLKEALRYARNNEGRFTEELIRLVEIPSISTDPTHSTDMRRAAKALADELDRLEFQNVRIIPTAGHPVVFGERSDAGADCPTVLIYGHYDVQPAEPIDLWVSDPFTPVIREGVLYGRGVSDMKGQVVASLKAVESLLSVGKPPVNIKFLFEGEEEIGSPNLASILGTYKGLLTADFSFNPDAGMVAENFPSIIYGLRGLAYFELRVDGPAHDLHSGSFGGVVHNPAQAMCELLAGLHDAKGRVTLPGFYDRVVEMDLDERRELAHLPIDEEFYQSETGVNALWGEPEYSPVERIVGRPTLEIHGLSSGFTGVGSKTIIPAYALAKISCRLVPDQDPEEINRAFVTYLQKKASSSIRCNLTFFGGSPAVISNRSSHWIQALRKAEKTVWGREPGFKREGGSIPVVTDIKKILGIDSVMTGFGLPNDNAHGPNERFNLNNFSRGIETIINFLYNLVDPE